PDALPVGPAERLEQLPEPFGRDHRTGVADPDGRLAASGHRGYLGPAAAGVMPDRVVDEVRDEAFRQPRITCRRGFGQPGLDADAPAVRFLVAHRDHVPSDGRQVKRRPLLDAALAAG